MNETKLHGPRWLAALVLSITAAGVWAQSAPGKDEPVPAPAPDATPTAGETNPAKHDASDAGKNALSQSPLERDPKARLGTDSQFLEDTAADGSKEMAASRLAADKAANPQVKALAQRLIADHEQMAAQLPALATEAKATLPTTLDAKRQAAVDRLAKTPPADFDKAYLQLMVKDHQQAIAAFEKRSQSKDSAIKRFVDASLPTLRAHLASASALYRQQPAH